MADNTLHQFVELSPREAELSKLFTGRDETVKVAPEGWTNLKAMKKHINEYKNFEFEDDDVVVNTFPKSSTTWFLELLWTMKNNPNLDNPKANIPIGIRCPTLGDEAVLNHFFEERPLLEKMFCMSLDDYDQSYGMFLYSVMKSPKPRTIKCHLPFTFLSPTILEKGKVVYVIRDRRDVCISYHHHCRLFVYEKYQGTFDQFIDAFIESAVLLGPYWAHVKQAWSRRHLPNVLVLFYEKLKKNPKVKIVKWNSFIGTKLTDDQLEKICQFVSFDEMKTRGYQSDEASHLFLDMVVAKDEGGFFRKGEAGGWKKVLTQQQKDKFEAWIEKNCPDKEIMKNILSP